MKPSSNILLVHTGAGGVGMCSRELADLGIARGDDYLASTNTEILHRHITEDKPQLLFVDSFRGNLPRVKKLVGELRAVNSQLIAILIEGGVQAGDDEIFDAKINMFNPDWDEQLAGKIRAFQKGDLRRPNPNADN